LTSAKGSLAPKILCAGIIVLDEVFHVERFPGPGEKAHAHGFFTEAEPAIAKLGRLFGRNASFEIPEATSRTILHGDVEHLDSASPFSRDFWLWLGCDYVSVDVDGGSGSIELDLNCDDVPRWARAKYHLVTNFGTTEHVANQLNAFRVIHDLAAPQGVMVHHVPGQGYFNHGLVNYNPKFFWMLSLSNGYKVLDMNFLVSPAPYNLPRNVVDYMGSFLSGRSDRLKDYQSTDALMTIVLQKIYDILFVAPVDVNPTMVPVPKFKHRILDGF
jgi:hypothetical protein